MSSHIFLVICIVAFASCINGQDKQYFKTDDLPYNVGLGDILGSLNNAQNTDDDIQNLLGELNQMEGDSYQDDENELAALEAQLAGLNEIGSQEADTGTNSMELLEAEIQRLEGQQSHSSTEQLEHELEALGPHDQSAELSDRPTDSLPDNDDSLEDMERELANLLQQGKSSEVSDGDDGDDSLQEMEQELAALLQEDQSGELSLGNDDDNADSLELRDQELSGLLQDDESGEVQDVGSADVDDHDDSLEALEQELLQLANQQSGEDSLGDDADDNSLQEMERELQELLKGDHSAEDPSTGATYDDNEGSLEEMEAQLQGLLGDGTSAETEGLELNQEQNSAQTEVAGLNDDATSANIDNDDDDNDDNNDDAFRLAGLLNANAEVAQVEKMIKQMQTPGAGGDFNSFLKTLTQLEGGHDSIAQNQGSMASTSLSSHGISSGSTGSNAAAQIQQTYTQEVQSGAGTATNQKESYNDNTANTVQVSVNGGSETNQANSYTNNEQSNTHETHQYTSSSSSHSGTDQDNLLNQILQGFEGGRMQI